MFVSEVSFARSVCYSSNLHTLIISRTRWKVVYFKFFATPNFRASHQWEFSRVTIIFVVRLVFYHTLAESLKRNLIWSFLTQCTEMLPEIDLDSYSHFIYFNATSEINYRIQKASLDVTGLESIITHGETFPLNGEICFSWLKGFPSTKRPYLSSDTGISASILQNSEIAFCLHMDIKQTFYAC